MRYYKNLIPSTLDTMIYLSTRNTVTRSRKLFGPNIYILKKICTQLALSPFLKGVRNSLFYVLCPKICPSQISSLLWLVSSRMPEPAPLITATEQLRQINSSRDKLVPRHNLCKCVTWWHSVMSRSNRIIGGALLIFIIWGNITELQKLNNFFFLKAFKGGSTVLMICGSFIYLSSYSFIKPCSCWGGKKKFLLMELLLCFGRTWEDGSGSKELSLKDKPNREMTE